MWVLAKEKRYRSIPLTSFHRKRTYGVWSKCLAQNWEVVKKIHFYMLFYRWKQRTNQGRFKMKQKLTLFTHDLSVLHWDILNGFSAECKEFGQTARTASNKKSYHQMRIYYVLGSVMWVICSSTNFHFPLADMETKTHREKVTFPTGFS